MSCFQINFVLHYTLYWLHRTIYYVFFRTTPDNIVIGFISLDIVIDTVYQLQEALTYSDKKMSAVPDLFGDDPKVCWYIVSICYHRVSVIMEKVIHISISKLCLAWNKNRLLLTLSESMKIEKNIKIILKLLPYVCSIRRL